MLISIYFSCINMFLLFVLFLITQGPNRVLSASYYTKEKKLELREQVRKVFQHAYDGYLKHAVNYDELRPLTCDGIDTWGSYSLTLIDALDTLATMGNYTEFRRVALLLEKKINFDRDINVSVFETNIRIVGGLISAHLLSKKAGLKLEPGWPCQGPLLRLAEDVAKRLLPAFDTATGMPYGTVNLRNGVPKGETSITCTACIGTFLVEFGTISRLTGNPIYEEVALNAIHTLWTRRSPIGLFGNHIDVQTGRWTAVDAGIGAGVDSFFEYLVKGAIMFNRPELLQMFHEARYAIDKYQRRDDWYVWVGMNQGQLTLPVFQSLEAFWPGVLSLLGDIGSAIRTFAKYHFVFQKYGFLPEFYNIPLGEATQNRESYPLRPELVESAMYLYRATKDHFFLEMGESMLKTIEFSAKTKCGYATIRNVVTHEKENRMESFFLAETTKYLYLLFDENNFMHNVGGSGTLLNTTHGQCVINAGAYIFNTEAHPIDMSALYCCHDIRKDIYDDLDLEFFSENSLLKMDRERRLAEEEERKKFQCQRKEDKHDNKKPDTNTTAVDIEVLDENNKHAAEMLIENFEKIRIEKENNLKNNASTHDNRNQLSVSDLEEFFSKKRSDFPNAEAVLIYIIEYMKNFTLDSSFIAGLQIFDKNITNILGIGIQKEYEGGMRTLWVLYELKHRYEVNVKLAIELGLTSFKDDNVELFGNIIKALNYDSTATKKLGPPDLPKKSFLEKINMMILEFENSLVNTTTMQEFLIKILIKGTNDTNRTYQKLLNDNEINSLKPHILSSKERFVLFKYIRKNVNVRKQMYEIYQKLQTLTKNDKEQPTTQTNNDDIVIATDKAIPKQDDELESQLMPEEINADEQAYNLTDAEDTEKNDSVWSQLVQTIFKTTTPQRMKFDTEALFQKTRQSLHKFLNKSVKYEVFTCRKPKFIEKFAYRNFYP